MEPGKKELSFVFILLSVIIGGAVIFQWALVNDIYSPSPAVLLQFEKLLRKAIMFRFIYVNIGNRASLSFPSTKKKG